MFGRPHFHRCQFHGNLCKRRGDSFYPVRQKFHHQTETGKRAGEFQWHGAKIWRMQFSFHFPQARWPASDLRQLPKLGGSLFDAPDEMVPAPAQIVQRLDPILIAEVAR